MALPQESFANRIDELQQEIQNLKSQREDLEREISQIQGQLSEVGSEKRTLQNAIAELDAARNKLNADIRLTENRIASASLTLEELSIAINANQGTIESQKEAIERSLRNIYRQGKQSLVEQVLAGGRISDAWQDSDSLLQFQSALQANIEALAITQENLREDQDALERKQRELSALQQDLASERSGLDANRDEKNDLLEQTENQEERFQRLLQEKVAAREAFERDLAALESELEIAIDPTRIPQVGTGVLKWPFSADFIRRCAARESALQNLYCITQYFGNTPFATQNPQIYSGSGHNGIDFGAPTGTPIEAPLAGRVVEVGNTDQFPGCYSYGKWALIEHANGLSTLYAHLSGFAVGNGQRVNTGDVIGYVGNTGFSTGPHLHFAVFASHGVQVVRFGDVKPVTNCPNARIPVAPREAYLNPLSYL